MYVLTSIEEEEVSFYWQQLFVDFHVYWQYLNTENKHIYYEKVCNK